MLFLSSTLYPVVRTASMAQHKPDPFIIGIGGNSGHGKSSLLNAVLNARTVLPTTSTGHVTVATITNVTFINNTEFPYSTKVESTHTKEWKCESPRLFDLCLLMDKLSSSMILRKLQAARIVFFERPLHSAIESCQEEHCNFYRICC